MYILHHVNDEEYIHILSNEEIRAVFDADSPSSYWA